jgi:hypothetical protein
MGSPWVWIYYCEALKMEQQIMLYLQYAGFMICGFSLLGFMYLAGLIKKSVGFDFVKALSKAKMAGLKNKSVIVLRIRDLSGNELYQTHEVSEVIIYKFKQNSEFLEKVVIYNERAVTMWNGIKILNVSPASVLPIDRDTGLYVNINPELTNKIITDSGKTAQSDKDTKELMKTGLYLGAILLLATIVAISYFYDNQVDLMGKLEACYKVGSSVATIVANG